MDGKIMDENIYLFLTRTKQQPKKRSIKWGTQNFCEEIIIGGWLKCLMQ